MTGDSYDTQLSTRPQEPSTTRVAADPAVVLGQAQRTLMGRYRISASEASGLLTRWSGLLGVHPAAVAGLQLRRGDEQLHPGPDTVPAPPLLETLSELADALGRGLPRD